MHDIMHMDKGSAFQKRTIHNWQLQRHALARKVSSRIPAARRRSHRSMLVMSWCHDRRHTPYFRGVTSKMGHILGVAIRSCHLKHTSGTFLILQRKREKLEHCMHLLLVY